MNLKSIFINPKESRLRAGYRILFFLIVFMSLGGLIFLIKPLLGDITKREFVADYALIIVTVLAFSATVSVYLVRRFLDKKTFVSLGLEVNKKSMMDLVFGFLLSGAMAGSFFLILQATGLIEFHGFNLGVDNGLAQDKSGFVQFMSVISIGSLGLLLLEHILVGYWEELVFRGYLFQNMVAGMGLSLAILVSCLIYGLIHAGNPNAGILSSSIIVMFGFLRLYGYLSTKLLWLPIGMHIGWNFFQGPVFGFAASGHKMATLFNVTQNGPDWLTGGEFGPEASIIVIPIVIGTLFVIRWWAQKQYPLDSLK
jgi:membrane protease YdiL (CAAX protease family)